MSGVGGVAAALAQLPLADGWRARPAVDGDADGLVALIEGVYGEYPGCVLDPDDLDADLFAWASHLAGKAGEGWVVLDPAGAVAGCVGVGVLAADRVELKRLYVGPSARRRGLGAALVAVVEAWAAARGHTVVELWSDTRFTDAHRLYERLGYRRTGEHRELHDPSETTEAGFERRLPA